MAWTAPTTFVAGKGITHTQLNNNLYYNMQETMVAKATDAGQLFQAGGNNSVNPVQIVTFAWSGGFVTSSTSYVTITGSSFTATLQDRCLLIWTADINTSSNTNSARVYCSPEIVGKFGATDTWASAQGGNSLTNIGFDFQGSYAIHLGAMGPGTYTFRLRLRSTDGSSVANTQGRMTVIPL